MCSRCVAFLALLFCMMRCCFRFLMHCQSASKEMFNRASRPNASCVGVACVVVCTIHRTASWTAARTPWNPKAGSRSCLLCVPRVHAPDHLVDAFNHTIGLRVSRGNDLAFKTKVVLQGSSDFACFCLDARVSLKLLQCDCLSRVCHSIDCF